MDNYTALAEPFSFIECGRCGALCTGTSWVRHNRWHSSWVRRLIDHLTVRKDGDL